MEKKINIGDIELNYDETGPENGIPVIIMHGWGCKFSTIRSVADIINHNMHVYNLDLPGHGDSNEPASVWGVEDFTRCIENFCRKLNINNPVVIGHSFGGRVGIVFASRNPVNKLILIDAAGIKPKRKLSYYWRVYRFKLIKKAIFLFYGKRKGESVLNEYRSRHGSQDYRNSTPMMRAIMSKCVNEDLKHLMPFIKAPTLLVWGNQDTATPLSDAKIMEKLIPDAGLVNFEGCGHYSFLDNPFGFKAVICEFLKNEMK